MKKMLVFLLALALMAGCVGLAGAQEQKPVILMVSFGASYNESRDATIGAVEAAVQAAYPEYEVRRAFTAQTVIDILRERDGLEIDNVTQAMERLIADGVKKVVVQPTHVMNGFEYDDVVREVGTYAGQFETLVMGQPLLTRESDYEKVIAALLSQHEDAGSDEVALVYMGHGTEHYANATYSQLESMMHSEGYENAFVGTVEGFPRVEQVLARVQAYGAKKVILAPLMVVAGDHANNDMAGDEEDSWKTVFTEAGFEVECVLEGLGQNEAIQAIYVEHVQQALEGGSL